MAWTSPKTYVAGSIHTAAELNIYERDNFITIRAGGLAIVSQTALDFIYASSSTQLARLSAIAGKFPRLNSAGNAWEMHYPTAGIHELFVLAAAFRPKVSGGPGGLEDVLLSSGRYISAMPFDGTTLEGAYIHFSFPKSWNKGNLTFQPYWFNTAGGSGAVVWSGSGVAASDGDSLDAAVGTAQTSTDTVQAAEVLCIGPESSPITLAGSPLNDDDIRFEIERTPAAGGDTYASDAFLFAVKWRFTTDNSDDA